MELDSYRRDYINSPAWIGTGDAELKSEKIFSQWAQAYEPLLDRIGIFSLPHHGSQGNFSEDILNRVRARFFVSHSKALGKNRHHPNASVIQALQRDGRFCAYCDGVETPVVWHVVFQI
jgi:beta-lactamase superfamily II metal-dependent hydrolase